MSNLQPYTPITLDALGGDTTKIPNYIENMLRPLNSTLLAWSTALTGTLTVGANIAGMVYPPLADGWLNFKTGPKYTTGVFTPIKFAWSEQSAGIFPHIVDIGYLQQQNGALITSVVSMKGMWTYDSTSNQITINYIAGLLNNTSYYITFEAR